MTADGPLAGLRVVDLGTALAGPVCATLLGEFGADVIKVERPGRGDPLRSFGPAHEGVPLWWMVEGRNKRSVTLDVVQPRGQAIVRRLAGVSDVLVENFRPGTMQRWGLGPDDLRAVNPELVYVSVSGFGQTGPYRSRPAYDRVAQAMSGLTYLTGHPDAPPVKPGLGITDYTAAVVAAFGCMLALYARDRGGTGQQVDTAMYEALLRMFHYHIPEYDRTGRIPERTGNSAEAMVPAECFESVDGSWLMIAAGSDGVFRRLAEAIDRPGLADDPRFATNEGRMRHADEVHAVVRAWVGERPASEVCTTLEGAGVPVAPLYDVRDIVEDPHIAAREAIVTVHDPTLGPVRMQGVVPRLVRTPGRVATTGPRLGQHNDEVYGELLGMTAEELRELEDVGVI